MSLSIKDVKKTKKRNYYFTKEVQEAIENYNASDNIEVKNKLFSDFIHEPLRRLAEAIIKTYKITYTDGETIDDLIHEVIIHLYKNLYLFDKEKGSAYSYFGTAAKRYLIIYSTKNFKKLKETTDPSEVDSEDISKNKYDENEYIVQESITDYFTDKFCDYLESKSDIYFNNDQDLMIAEAIISIIRNRDSLDIIDKKSFQLYLRNMVDVNDNKITEVYRFIKDKYHHLYKKFDKYGYL